MPCKVCQRPLFHDGIENTAGICEPCVATARVRMSRIWTAVWTRIRSPKQIPPRTTV